MKRIAGMLLLWWWVVGVSAAEGDTAESKPRERSIMGWIESVVLVPSGIKVKAKLDSGAKTSSLHAEKIERIDKEGRDWVRFVLETRKRNKKLQRITIEEPLARVVRIKRHRSGSYERPVVKLKFCLNGIDYETEFSLVDRSEFNYPVLLGRGFLKDVALVDTNAAFLTSAGTDVCQAKHPPPSSGKKTSASAGEPAAD